MPDSSLFIDVVLWAVYVLLAAAVGAALWSAVHGVRTHEQTSDPLMKRRTQVIGYVTAAVVALLLVLTYLLASTQPVMSNGQPFTDELWLRLSDMFILTSIILIGLCSVIVVVARFRR